MESEEDLAARLTERLPIEEAEECLCQLEEHCITVGVLGEADAQDLADELGFTERQCDAVLLDDEAWQARYGQGQAGAPGVQQANANVAVQEPSGEATPDSNLAENDPGVSSVPADALSEAMKKEPDSCDGDGPLLQEVSERTTESLPPVHTVKVTAAENGAQQLVVTVECPHAATAGEVDLQVSATEVFVAAPGQLSLLLPLQYTVDADSMTAKYNQKKRLLTVICKMALATRDVSMTPSINVLKDSTATDCGKMCTHAAVLQGMFKFGGIELFGRSLEEHLGGMSNDAVAGLYAEHEMAADSDSEFTAPNHPAAGTTTPRQEFRVVVGEDGVDTEKWSLNPTAEPTCGADARVPGRVVRPIAHYMRCEQVPRAALTLGEVIALRLFTGPMSAKYNKVLRETTLRESAAQPDAGLEAQVDVEGTTDLEVNTYSTTIGLIISGILKLGRIATAPRRNVKGTAIAYCGLDGLDLPPVLFTPDEQGFCGAVVPAFLSLSDDEAVADAYSGVAQGKVATIFELELSKGSLGAEVAWLSQFPKDQERLLPPWTHLQVVGSPTRRADRATVFRMRPTVFQNVRTVEEVAGARKEEIRAHIAGLVMDVRSQADFDWDDSMSQGHSQSPNLDSLIQRLAFAHRLAAFEQDLLARFCKYQAKWYDDNGKYKSTFLGVLREVNDARAQLADPASALSKRLASTVDSSAAGSVSGLPELSVGAKVEIHSLVRAPDLNGAKGEIVGPQDQGTGRWIVKIGEGRLVKLKSNNLRCMRAVDANSGDEVPASLSASKESPLHAALTLIKSEESLQIMEKLVRNCAESPGEEKFRKVRSTNEKIRACLGAEGAKSAMAAMGWVEQDDCLVLPPGVKLGMEEVNAIKTARSMLIKPTQSSSANAAAAIAPQGDAPASSSSGAVYRLHTKFFQDPTLFQDPSKSFCAKFGSDDEFAGGIQGKLGKMDLEFVKRMYFEHNRAHDAQIEFAYGNKGKTSTAQHEWRFVVGSHGVNVRTWSFDVERAEPEYTPEDLVEGRNAKPLRELMQLPRVKEAGLRVAEVVGLRLYSGPLFAAYNRVQRGFAKDGDTLYTTTAHLIKSGIFKLAMITAPPADLTLYRGTGNMALGPAFFKRDAQGFAGGVERGFMSATASRQVALEFAGMEAEEGKEATKQLPTLYVIDVGKMSIGANIADISQFEGEEEFVYPMLTRLELTKEPELSPDGKMSLIHLKLTVNQRSTTVEDAEQARRRFLVRLAHSLQWSLRNWARQRAGLTERLRPQVVGVLRRLLDEVRGAELAVLNTNEGYGQVFERIMHIWEETLRQEVVEALWQDGEHQPPASRAAVWRFMEAIDAAQQLCADSKEVRDRVVEMRRVVMRATGGGENEEAEACAKLDLAEDLNEQNKYDEALEVAHQAVDLFTAIGGRQHPGVATSHRLIGIVYKNQGRLQEALVQYQKALGVFVSVYGQEHDEVVGMYGDIGNVYSSQGRHQEALVQYQKTLKMCLASVGPDDLRVAAAYHCIAAVYRAQGRYVEALDYYHRDLDITLRLLSPDHPNVAKSYENIGNVYQSQDRHEEAHFQYQKALEVYLNVYGEEHALVAKCYSNIGALYGRKGDQENALLQFQRALEMQTRVFGSEHPVVAASYGNIGLVYAKKGDLENALLQFKKALEIETRVFGSPTEETGRHVARLSAVLKAE